MPSSGGGTLSGLSGIHPRFISGQKTTHPVNKKCFKRRDCPARIPRDKLYRTVAWAWRSRIGIYRL